MSSDAPNPSSSGEGDSDAAASEPGGVMARKSDVFDLRIDAELGNTRVLCAIS